MRTDRLGIFYIAQDRAHPLLRPGYEAPLGDRGSRSAAPISIAERMIRKLLHIASFLRNRQKGELLHHISRCCVFSTKFGGPCMSHSKIVSSAAVSSFYFHLHRPVLPCVKLSLEYPYFKKYD